MPMLLRTVFSGALLLSAAACADVTSATAPPSPAPRPQSVVDTETDADAGLIVRVKNADVSPDLYNRQVVGWMYYDGLAAQMQGNASVRDDKGSESLALVSPTQRVFGIWNFFGNTFRYAWSVPIRYSCGTTVWASIRFHAWLDGPSPESGTVAIDDDDDVRTESRAQDPCGEREEEIDPPHAGDGTGGGTIEKPADNSPYSKCVVRITYDRRTGETISVTVLYCY